jgi:hypothetical protein
LLPNEKSVTPVTDLTRGIYRRIYAGFIEGRRINQLSLQAEAWFWRVLATTDDFGNAKGEARSCWLATVGHRDNITVKHVAGWLQEMANAGLIELYEAKGEHFLHVTGFEEMQPCGRNGKRIQRFPLPDESRIIRVNPEKSRINVSPDTEDDTEDDTENDGLPFHGQAFLAALRGFEKHRKEKRATLTPTARSRLFAKLTAWGEERSTAALLYSTEQGYTGCFEANGENGNGAHKPNVRETAAERTARILRERNYEKSAEELAGYYDPVH